MALAMDSAVLPDTGGPNQHPGTVPISIPIPTRTHNHHGRYNHPEPSSRSENDEAGVDENRPYHSPTPSQSSTSSSSFFRTLDFSPPKTDEPGGPLNTTSAVLTSGSPSRPALAAFSTSSINTLPFSAAATARRLSVASIAFSDLAQSPPKLGSNFGETPPKPIFQPPHRRTNSYSPKRSTLTYSPSSAIYSKPAAGAGHSHSRNPTVQATHPPILPSHSRHQSHSDHSYSPSHHHAQVQANVHTHTRSHTHSHGHSQHAHNTAPLTQNSVTHTIGAATDPKRLVTNPLAVIPELASGLLIPLALVLIDSPSPLISTPSLSLYTNTPLLLNSILGCSILAAGALMLSGIFGALATPSTIRNFRTGPFLLSTFSNSDRLDLLSGIVVRTLQVLAPFYAASELGPMWVGPVLLVALSAGLAIAPNRRKQRSLWATLNSRIQDSPACMCVLATFYVVLLIQVMSSSNIFRGLFALGCLSWSLIKPIPLIGSGYQFFYSKRESFFQHDDDDDGSTVGNNISEKSHSTTAVKPASIHGSIAGTYSPALDPLVSIFSGVLLTLFSVILSTISPSDISFSSSYPICILVSAAALLFVRPTRLKSPRRYGIGLGCVVLSLVGFSRMTDHWAARTLHFMFSTAVFTSAYYDSALDREEMAVDSDEPDHHSAITGYLLAHTQPGSIVRSILIQKDSRRIAYFGCLNLAFMMVQFCYGFLTGSLGLLTDSIHMLFDCAGLAVGLTAAVMSKWPSTTTFPYGYGKVETLSGFANGVFLILVSVEIVADAIDRLKEGYELRRLNELLVVSILGFVVNIVGLLAFGHAHHHHDHDHGPTHGASDHGHGHSHDHEHSHAHSVSGKEPEPSVTELQSPFNITSGHSHSHSHLHFASSPSTHLPAPPTAPPAASNPHTHSHDNENMEGIFLHILADALGSVSVIISTVLTKWTSWSGWDPIASCMISALIFASAVPLVRRSGARLLLSLSDQADWQVRQALGELGNLPGVVGYRYARFWMADAAAMAPLQIDKHDHDHDHDHHHDHAYTHDYDHDHDHGHDHKHNHGHDHDHEKVHKHDHGHEKDHKHNHGSSPCSSQASGARLQGAIHIITTSRYDLEDVRHRSSTLLSLAGLDVVVHVEREADAVNCWCSSTNTLVGHDDDRHIHSPSSLSSLAKSGTPMTASSTRSGLAMAIASSVDGMTTASPVYDMKSRNAHPRMGMMGGAGVDGFTFGSPVSSSSSPIDGLSRKK